MALFIPAAMGLPPENAPQIVPRLADEINHPFFNQIFNEIFIKRCAPLCQVRRTENRLGAPPTLTPCFLNGDRRSYSRRAGSSFGGV
jgi:hypothetical protein